MPCRPPHRTAPASHIDHSVVLYTRSGSRYFTLEPIFLNHFSYAETTLKRSVARSTSACSCAEYMLCPAAAQTRSSISGLGCQQQPNWRPWGKPQSAAAASPRHPKRAGLSFRAQRVALERASESLERWVAASTDQGQFEHASLPCAVQLKSGGGRADQVVGTLHLIGAPIGLWLGVCSVRGWGWGGRASQVAGRTATHRV